MSGSTGRVCVLLAVVVPLNIFVVCSADKENTLSPIKVSGITEWGFDQEPGNSREKTARRRRRSSVVAKLSSTDPVHRSRLSHTSHLFSNFHVFRAAPHPLHPSHLSNLWGQEHAQSQAKWPHPPHHAHVSHLSQLTHVAHRSHLSRLSSSTQSGEISSVTGDDLAEDVEDVDNFVKEAQSERKASEQQAVATMEETVQTVEMQMIEENVVMVEEEVVMIEELTEEVVEIIEEIEVVDEVKEVVVVKTLKEDIRELKTTVESHKREHKTNSQSISDLKKRLGQAEKTIRDVVGDVMAETTSSVLKETLLRVEMATQIIAEEHSVSACKDTVVEIRKLMKDGLKNEVEDNREYSEKLTSSFRSLKENLLGVHSAADSQIQSMADKLKAIVDDMRSIVERAKEERDTNRGHTKVLLQKADGLARFMTQGIPEDLPPEALKKCRAGVELQRELAIHLGSRVFDGLRRQGMEMIELRQRLTADDEKIMEQSQTLEKSQSEITRMGDLLKKTQRQERHVTNKKAKDTLIQVETKIEKTIIVCVEKRIERTDQSSEKMLTGLKESIDSTNEKLLREQSARERTDTKVEEMKGQIRKLMEKVESSDSEADVSALKGRLEVTTNALKKETAERKKSEAEIEALKDMVRSLAVKVDSQAIEMRTLVTESKKQVKEVKSLRADAEQTIEKVKEIGLKNEQLSKKVEASIKEFREHVDQEIEQRERSTAELSDLKEMVMTTITKTEARVIIIRKEKETKKETDTTENESHETGQKHTSDTESHETETKAEQDNFKKLEEVRRNERRQIERQRKFEREHKAKEGPISPVCTSNVIVPSVFMPQGAEGACVDSRGYMYDSWYGPISCIKECKKACSLSINCVGFDIFNETMCEARYDAGRVPSTKPWPRAQGRWLAGNGKGPVKGVVEKGLADRTCFIKM